MAALLLVACKKTPPLDGVCTNEPLPTGLEIPSDHGGIQVLASTDVYFAVRDTTGKQIASKHANDMTPVPAGDYQVVLNNSVHSALVQSKILTKCATGAVLVNGKTDEYYAVLDNAAHQLASAHLAAAISLFPGSYQVRLNNTDVTAHVQAGSMLELKPGTLNVDVGTDEYYAILDAATRQLASSHMGRALSVFAGSYVVRINNCDAKVEVRSGEPTNVPSGKVVLSHDRRRVVHFNVTEHPTEAWTAQQIREAFPWEEAPRYLVRDRDAIFGKEVIAVVKGMGIEEVVTAAQSPWQNPYVERLIGSIRRECLNHVIVWNERGLRRTLRSYLHYYGRSRTHLALSKDAPEPRAVDRPENGLIIEIPEVGGLHHRYERRAA